MRVLLITGAFPPMRCGAAGYTHELAMTLSRLPDLHVGVLTSRAAAELGTPTAFSFFPIVETWGLNDLTKILQCLREWTPDLVHIQIPTQGYGRKRLPWMLPLILWLRGIPLVQTWHGYPHLKHLIQHGLVLRYMSAAIVPSGLVMFINDFRSRTSASLRWIYKNKEIRQITLTSQIPTLDLAVSERATIRSHYARPSVHVIVFFGLIYPSKRVELLFEIADPGNAHLVIIGDSLRGEDKSFLPRWARETNSYHQRIRALSESPQWRGKVTMTGFLPDLEAARVVAAADAVVLPFLGGANNWNTTLHAAQAQGTFVLTTSSPRSGYDAARNTYFASPDDVEDMRRGLRQHIGKRTQQQRTEVSTNWQSIGEIHAALYRQRICKARAGTVSR